MFGLHIVPAIMIAGAIVVLVALLVGFIVLKRHEPEFAGILSGVLLLVAIVVAIIGIAAFPKEAELETRDAAIRAKLIAENIRVVSLDDWDQRVTVQIGNCVADYQFAPNAAADDVWPLVPGTGRAVEGCNDLSLDRQFIIAH